MTDLTIILLKKFNERFILFISYFRKLAPEMKDLILVEDGLDFCIQRGNPEIPISLFYKYIYPYKKEIYKKNDDLFRTNFLMKKINEAIQKSKTDKENYFGNKKEFIEESKTETIQLKISTSIDKARNIWDSLSQPNRDKIWKKIQILIKLSEKYVQSIK